MGHVFFPVGFFHRTTNLSWKDPVVPISSKISSVELLLNKIVLPLELPGPSEPEVMLLRLTSLPGWGGREGKKEGGGGRGGGGR